MNKPVTKRVSTSQIGVVRDLVGALFVGIRFFFLNENDAPILEWIENVSVFSACTVVAVSSRLA